MPAQSDAAPEETVGFEQILDRLRAIVDQLEKGDLPLERSLELFEEGIRLSRLGAGRLDAAEKRIEQLLAGDDPTGQPRRAAVDVPGAGT